MKRARPSCRPSSACTSRACGSSRRSSGRHSMGSDRPGLIAGGATSVVGALFAATDAGPGLVAVGLFAIGLGWSATFLGATAVISDLTQPNERAGALGFTDLLVSLSSAVAGFTGGFVFEGARGS